MKLNYLLLDVFTRERLKGNQLAVVAKADDLSETQMQAIAREFNLSETVFLLKRRPSATPPRSAFSRPTPSCPLPVIPRSVPPWCWACRTS